MNHQTFKRVAKNHQIKFREKNVGNNYNTYVTWLTNEDGKAGKNFYYGYDVFKAVKDRFPNFYINLYCDTLRSEHIPFNFFVPFRHDLKFCRDVFNNLLGNCISSIESTCIIDKGANIKIEFAPKPKERYLYDGTSFDTYIEYIHTDNSRGIIGIEVKYTEKEYGLKAGSTEAKAIKDLNSRYFIVTNECQTFKEDSFNALGEDIYRQIWRNHLLGESILIADRDKFKHFTSLTFYPSHNSHFDETSKKYKDLLSQNRNRFDAITYEEFFKACYQNCPDDNFRNWINYLQERYIVTE